MLICNLSKSALPRSGPWLEGVGSSNKRWDIMIDALQNLQALDTPESLNLTKWSTPPLLGDNGEMHGLWGSTYKLRTYSIYLPGLRQVTRFKSQHNLAKEVLGLLKEETIEPSQHIPAGTGRICIEVIGTNWIPSKCLSVDKWIDKLWYIQSMDYCTSLKRNKVCISK